ncbi:hypothetical protein BX616_003473 [Lobosporangium transversale]|nr:hypothetical protein BX616_003473 [Lobosporangium transversale]
MASTYFQGTRNYTDVTITDEGINTQEFLEATEGLVKIFDLFGTVFGVVQSDMNGNIKKIRDRYLQNPVVNSTLQNLVKGEIAEKKKTATEGLLWLTRGLDFTLQSLERSEANPGEELSVSFTKGYEATLRHHIHADTFGKVIPTIQLNHLLERLLNPAHLLQELYCSKKNVYTSEAHQE